MSFEIKGLKELQTKLDKVAKASTSSGMAAAIRASRCAVHGQTPTNVGVVGGKVTAEFCCVGARDQAIKAATDGTNRAIS